MTALSFHDVTITRGGRHVLSGVNLEIEPGEFIGMFGANGSGKTTLLRAALGVQPVEAGAVRVFGAAVGVGNAQIGYMPQTRSGIANSRFTGWDYVAAALDAQRWGVPYLGTTQRREIDRVLDLVSARDLARRPLREMSGGERQRLLLSQALIGNPKLLLLDEPLINLDPRRQASVVDIVRRLQQELKLTVIFSAHELNPLLGAMDRVLYLAGGRAALGEVDEVVDSAVLSRLYGSPIEVLRLKGRIFVMSGGVDVDACAHGHDHHDDGHAHDDAVPCPEHDEARVTSRTQIKVVRS